MTAVLLVPVTLALKGCDPAGPNVTSGGATVTATGVVVLGCALGGDKLIDALALWLLLLLLVAINVTLVWLGMDAGAV